MSPDTTDDKSISDEVKAWSVKLQAISWANVDPYLDRHMPSLGKNELMWEIFIQC